MKVFISVVSHGHETLIKELNSIIKLSSSNVIVAIKSNTKGDDFSDFPEIDWINSNFGIGFGSNNNVVFKHFIEQREMGDDDIFMIVNPDVVISKNAIDMIVNQMDNDNVYFSGINLYKDNDYLIPDNSVRNFPKLIDFIKSFLGLNNNMSIDKSKITLPTNVDWVAGSFMAIKVSHFKQLKGFDEQFFMYCEDIDICYRSSLLGVPVTYYPNVKALHLAKHGNRNIFSKHFLWHIQSVCKFILRKCKLLKFKSILLYKEL